MFLNWLRPSAGPPIRAIIRFVVLLNLNVLPGFIIYLLVNLAESQGVEPCDPFYLIYGLANRCITILPTLEILLVPPAGVEPTLTNYLLLRDINPLFYR